jgi:hypothetical protein
VKAHAEAKDDVSVGHRVFCNVQVKRWARIIEVGPKRLRPSPGQEFRVTRACPVRGKTSVFTADDLCGLLTAAHAQNLIYGTQVLLHRRLGEVGALGDLGVARPLGDGARTTFCAWHHGDTGDAGVARARVGLD